MTREVGSASEASAGAARRGWRLIVAGSRGCTREQVFRALDLVKPGKVIEIVSGCNKSVDRETGKIFGADYWGEQWAKERGIPVKPFPANWDAYGLSAGPKRNRRMAAYADALLAIWDGKSRGTRNMIEEAEKRGLPTRVYRLDELMARSAAPLSEAKGPSSSPEIHP